MPQAGIWFASTPHNRTPTLIPSLGLTLLLTAPIISGTMLTPLPATSELQLALPIPNNASLRGAQLSFQSFHAGTGGFMASDAIELTIM